MIENEQKPKYPDSIVLGTYSDGTKVTLVQSKVVPGLYYSEHPIESEPLPSWMTDDLPEPKLWKNSDNLETKVKISIPRRLGRFVSKFVPSAYREN